MEVNSLQVHELHKKFDELNDEISLALRRQEDAINAAATSSTGAPAVAPRKDVMRLAKRAIDWREDVNALAKHIELQLQHSRALRLKEAEVLQFTTNGEAKIAEDDDGAKLRCLRSDLRLLHEFRLSYCHSKGAKDPVAAVEMMEAIEMDGKQLKELAELSMKKEKSGSKDALTPILVQLFEARRELAGKISEDILKEKKQLDLEVGLSDLTGGVGRGAGSADGSEKDVLASWDTQLYVRLVQGLLDLQREMKERFSNQPSANHSGAIAATTQRGRENATAGENTGSTNAAASTGSPVFDEIAPTGLGLGANGANPASSASGGGQQKTAAATLDEVNFAMQKLRRELADLRHAYAKQVIANSQLEDDITHLQRKYDDEKRAHVNEKKWYVPKIQKLEETVMTTARAFEGLKLNVELITNMYKTLSQTLVTHEVEENELKKERDHVALLLSGEIKKVALLTKESERKDKLVTIAMAARHEMCKLATHSEQRMLVLDKEKLALQHKAKEQEDELAVLKLQLEGAYSRLEATDDALGAAKSTMERLQREMDVCLEAAQVKEAELKTFYEKESQSLQQRFDKTKRELMDAMSQNLSLDGRLRKAQEKLNRLSGGATGPAKDAAAAAAASLAPASTTG